MRVSFLRGKVPARKENARGKAARAGSCEHLSPKDLSALGLCGGFGRAAVHELVTSGAISESTVNMECSVAEYAHIGDSQRHKSLALRCLATCETRVHARRPLCHFLLLSPFFRLSISDKEKLHEIRRGSLGWDSELVREIVHRS